MKITFNCLGTGDVPRIKTGRSPYTSEGNNLRNRESFGGFAITSLSARCRSGKRSSSRESNNLLESHSTVSDLNLVEADHSNNVELNQSINSSGSSSSISSPSSGV